MFDSYCFCRKINEKNAPISEKNYFFFANYNNL